MDEPIVDSGESAPAPAAEPIDATQALEQMSEPERQTWREKGDLPERITVGGKPEPAQPATSTTQEPKPLSKRQQEINEHIRARTEATQRADAAERRLADLEAKSRKVDETPPAQLPAPEVEQEPTLDDFMDQQDPYLAYTRAIAKYDAVQTLKAHETERQQRTRAEREQAEVQRVFTEYQTRETALKAQHPDFDAKTLAVRSAIDLRSPLGAALIDSPVAPNLILHFAEHPDEFERIGRLGMTSLPAALRELGKLEAKFEAGAPSAAAVDAPKHVTSAPRPPTTLGSHAADAADAVESAITRRDVGAYIREQNARDLAAARR